MRDRIAHRTSVRGSQIRPRVLGSALVLGLASCLATVPPPNASNLNGRTGNANLNSANTNSNENTGNQNAGGGGALVTVDIIDFAYEPMSVTINVGDRVRWRNNGQQTHTVTSGVPEDLEAGRDFSSVPLGRGLTFEHTFNTAGTFTYFDRLFPALMAGATVIVQEP